MTISTLLKFSSYCVFFQEISSDGSFLAYENLCKFLCEKKELQIDDKECEFRQVFNAFDESGDGFITEDELFQAMERFGEKMTRSELREIMAEADSNNDGQIDYS